MSKKRPVGRDGYVVESVSSFVNAYHLSMLNDVKTKLDIIDVNDKTKDKMDTAIETAIGQYFVNIFLPYVTPIELYNILNDQMSYIEITDNRSPEDNLGMLMVSGDYATLFKVLAPKMAKDYFHIMNSYLTDILEGDC